MRIKILDRKNRTFKGVLFYNKKEASLLLGIENYPGDSVAELCRELEYYSNVKGTLKDPVFHAVISYAYDDDVNHEDMIQHAREYMQEMGYGQQPYALFLHTDRDHRHVHIVSSRVDRTTLATIDDSNEWRRSWRINQKLERKYGLTKSLRGEKGLLYDLNEAVTDMLKSRPVNFKELEEECTKNGLVLIRSGRGVQFAFDDGQRRKPIDSSQLPVFKEKSLTRKLQANRYVKKKAKTYLNEVLEGMVTSDMPIGQYIRELKQKNIWIKFDRNASGIYGVRFSYMGISFKGSEVGYSWNLLKDRVHWPQRRKGLRTEGKRGGLDAILGVRFDTEARGARSMADDDDEEEEKRSYIHRPE